MLFSTLINLLKKQYQVKLIECNNDNNIIAVKALTDDGPFEKNTLYVASKKASCPDLPLMIICDELAYHKKILNFDNSVAVVKNEDLFNIIISIQKILDEEHSLNMEALAALVNQSGENRPMEFFLNSMARIMNNALVFLDQNMNIITYSTNYEIHDPCLSESVENGFCSKEFLQVIRLNKAMGKWYRGKSTQILKLDEDEHPKLATYTSEKEHLVCGLVMIEYHSQITEKHHLLLPLICNFLYRQYYNSPDYGQNTVSVHDTMLYKLLDESHNEELIQQISLAKIKYPLKMKVIVARFINHTENRFIKRTLMLEFKNIFANGHVVQYKSYIVLLVDNETLNYPALKELAVREDLSIGVSWDFYDISRIKEFYAQAVSCIKLATQLGKSRDVFDFSEYFIWDLLNICSSKIDLNNYIMPEIKKLKEYDEENSSFLCQTLKTYLDNNQNIQKTAKLLFIHRNTVLYRIQQIKDITDLNLRNLALCNKLRYILDINYYIDSFINRR